MRRFVVVFVLFLALTVAVSASIYEDGTYVGWSDASPNGTHYAKVFIENGEITAVILREFTDKHVEKDFSTYPWPEAGEAARTLGGRFVEKQGTDVDIVTGATGSSNGYIQAVERALFKAGPDKGENTYFNGTFLGRSEVSSYGQYYKVVWVTLQDDQIVDYSAQRVLPDHTIQDPSVEAYGWPLDLVRESYKKAALESEPGFVDTISGATGLTSQSNRAVRDALDKARID
ncbi:MAG: FMN-binding protein [Firmicutes bacterium]|nr:FMN-binding protein [Bacillota bacterium]